MFYANRGRSTPIEFYRMQSAILILRGRAAWAHDFNPDRTVGATFQPLRGASFVNGARQASDTALAADFAEMKWINGCRQRRPSRASSPTSRGRMRARAWCANAW